MSDILDKILATKREEVAAARKAESLEAVREAAEWMPPRAASSSAKARPMPLPAPVTTALLWREGCFAVMERLSEGWCATALDGMTG